MLRRTAKNDLGQVTLEFTFAMIMVVLLALGMIWTFQWVGKDLADRRIAHETTLYTGQAPLVQLQPYFYTSTSINAFVPSNIFGDDPLK